MSSNTQHISGKALEEEFAAAKKETEALKSLRISQEEELACLRGQSEETARKLNRDTQSEETGEIEEDLISGTPSFGYGTRMIGRTVLEASLYCNRLTGDGSDPSAKELVNLILGKTELIKAEMLKIVLSEKDAAEKRKEIDAQFEQVKDYFESVMRQIK